MMMKYFKKATTLFLALIMCISALGLYTFAADTVWYGESAAANITAGEHEYQFMSVYGPAYEMSNHMLSTDGGVNNDIPQTLIMVDASEDYAWSPDGMYSYNSNNYEIFYCCDAITGYEGLVHYRRTNLEDSTYYSADEAAHIRAIVMNSYPFVSLDTMKAHLAEEGFANAAELDRAEVIAAVQAAIWYYANGEEYSYSQTFNVSTNPQWGTVMHDYASEMGDEIQGLGKRVFIKDEAAGERINSLIQHLKNRAPVYPEDDQIVISNIEIVESLPLTSAEGMYNISILVQLNSVANSDADKITLDIYVGDNTVTSIPITSDSDGAYSFTVEAAAGETIKAVVSGTQYLAEGVYIYEPEGGREVSQCLVGLSSGENPVYADASVKVPEVSNPITADLKLKKVDNVGGTVIGAEFTLYAEGENGLIEVGTYAGNYAGEFVVEDLLPGNYTLKETKVPDGFVVPSSDIRFTIDETGYITLTSYEGAEVIDDNEYEKVDQTIVVVNTRETTAPETTVPETTVPDTTVPETEETVEEITDPEVPLAPSVPDDAEVFEEIDDPDIPLASVPQTGDTFSVWFVVSGVIACALCAVIIFSRKKEENA